jgi:DNA-binding protein H-NS
MAKRGMNLKDYSIEQLERLFAQVEKEKEKRSKDVESAKKKILSLMKEFGLSVADFAEAELKKSAPKKKTRRKKATRKSAKKTTAAAAKPAAKKAAPAKKAKVAKKKTSKKKAGKKVAPKYQNPEDKSMKWTGRGRQPLWVVAALKSGKTMDDLKI